MSEKTTGGHAGKGLAMCASVGLTVLAAAGKADGWLTWSWTAVLAPWWGALLVLAIAGLVTALVAGVAALNKKAGE